MSEPPLVRRDEVEAALQARQELGRAYEPELVDNLVEKIEQRLDARTRERRPAHPHSPDTRLILGSIALGVGATAIATGNDAAWLAVIVWIAIAVVNLAYALRR
jgi:hypothetical protein